MEGKAYAIKERERLQRERKVMHLFWYNNIHEPSSF